MKDDCNYYYEVYQGSSPQLGKMLVVNFSINREAPSLIYTHTLTHTCIAQERERKRDIEGGGPVSLVS